MFYLRIMKKITLSSFSSLMVFLCAFLPFLHSCAELKQAGEVLLNTEVGSAQLSNEEVIRGLKEALTQGARKAVDQSSVRDGFFGDPALFIPFPEEAIKVKQTAEQFGFSKQVSDFEETLNRAAEEASKEAFDIFASAVREMTLEDGFAILNGEEDAATTYLRNASTAQLRTRFSPKVRAAIESVKLTSYWQPLVSTYNTFAPFAGGQNVNPDLEAYVTERAIDGLFVHVAREEKRIRENPAARVSELLQRVFGSIEG